MKTVLAFFVAAIAVNTAMSQGEFTFRNHTPDWSAPVFDTDRQTKLQGPDFVAQAYGGFTPSPLTAAGPVTPFGTGPGAGTLQTEAIAVEVPGAGSYQIVFVQMRGLDRASKQQSWPTANMAWATL